MTTFSENFKVGDVVYGISQSRAPYVNSLGRNLREYCENTGAFLFCDSFNNRSFLGVSDRPYGVTAGGVGDTVKNPQDANDIAHNLDFYEHGRGIAVLGADERAAAKQFYDSLSHSKYNPVSAAGEKASKWSKLGDGTRSMLMIRRACKFGLEYMIGTGRQVHFVLDVPYTPGTSIDMQDVIDKRRYAGPVASAQGAVPITFSELRCCYRNQAKWMPTGLLKFYLNLTEVGAPWVTNPNLWQQYDLSRAKKTYQKKHPVKAKLGFGP